MSESFAALGVSAKVAQALAERDINRPFPIQSLVLPDALRGLDVLAKSPTGSGKTLAFAVPIVERIERADGAPAALVLVPTRELAAQAKEARGAQILVATPGRLQDLVDRRLVALDRVRVLVLDEADRMLDMGFKPQVERILRRVPADRQTMLFSATLDGEVGELARAYTRSPSRFEAGLPHAANESEVEHRFVPVTAEGKVERLVEELEAERGLALVFVRTKR